MKLLNLLVPQNVILPGKKIIADVNTEIFPSAISIFSHFKEILNKNYEIIYSPQTNMLVK